MSEKRDFLGEFEELVSRAIIRLGANAYGVTIREIIEEKGKRPTSFGAIYATLERLEQKGYVRSAWGEATPERGGRAKRYYSITASGLKAVNDTRAARESILADVVLDQGPIGEPA